MRIAIVLNTSWNIYNFRSGLIQSLQAAGHEIIAIAPEDNYSQFLEEDLNCKFYAIHMAKKSTNPFKDLYLLWQLLKLYARLKPDVVLQFTIKPNIYGALAASLLGIPTINNVCGLGTMFLRKGIPSRIARWLYRISFKFPYRVLFQNQDDLDLFVQEGLVKAKITELVPGSGVPLSKFTPQKNLHNDTFTFLMIARLIYDKGIVEFAEAIKILKKKGYKAKFLLLGQHDLQDKDSIPASMLQGWIEEGLFHYLGTSDHVAKHIAQADCVVLPSYREGTPRSLLEAASMAKPLIATDVAGCRQTIDNGINGYLCQLKDAEDLAKQMEKMLLLTPEQVLIMGQKSREKMEREFDEQIVIKRYLVLLDEFDKRVA